MGTTAKAMAKTRGKLPRQTILRSLVLLCPFLCLLLCLAVPPSLAVAQGLPLLPERPSETTFSGLPTVDHLISLGMGAMIGAGLVLLYHGVIPPELAPGPAFWTVGAAILGLIIADGWHHAGMLPPRFCVPPPS